MTNESKGRITSHIAIVMASQSNVCKAYQAKEAQQVIFTRILSNARTGNKKNVNMIQRIIVLRLFQSARNSTDIATKPSFSKI